MNITNMTLNKAIEIFTPEKCVEQCNIYLHNSMINILIYITATSIFLAIAMWIYNNPDRFKNHQQADMIFKTLIQTVFWSNIILVIYFLFIK